MRFLVPHWQARRWRRRAPALWCALVFAASAGAAEFTGSLVLGRPTNTSIAANLLAPTALTVYLEYGTQSGSYPNQTAATALTANQPLEVELKSLSPNTRHYYRLRFRAPAATTYDATPEYSFMTARPAGSTFMFCIQGDSHPERLKTQFDPTLYTRTLQTVAADNPDFYLTIGDDFSIDQLDPNTITAAQVTERYNIQRPYLGIIGKTAPVFLVNGNHEQAARYLLDGTPNNPAVWAQNARNSYFSQPAPDSFYIGNPEQVPYIGLLRNHFAWTWGDALFVAIDPYWGSPVCVDNPFFGGNKRSNLWDITHGDPQYQWLKATLEQSKAKYKFVFAHHVMGTGRGGIELAKNYEWGGQNANGSWGFTTNRPTWTTTIHQLFVNNKVTIFFQGHDHIWVHQQLDGVVYQTLSEPADPNYSEFNYDAYQTGDKFPNTGYTRVTVAPTGVKVDYVRTYLPADEGPGRISGAVAFSYTLGSLPDPTPAPYITQQPADQTVAAGSAATFAIAAVSTLPLSYQWQRNGVNLPGATASTLTISNVQAANTGSYTVVVKTSAGTVTSMPVALNLSEGRLSNLSVRTTVASSQTLTIGLVTDGPKGILIRAVGPGMATTFPQYFRPADVMADPKLELYNGSAKVDENDNWSGSLTVTMTSVGAFPLTAGSKDAALVGTINGPYTAQLKGTGSGVVMIDAFDTTASYSPHLTNVSARNQVGTGANILIAGFVIEGNTPKTVLIRGIGPGLFDVFGVTGVLADPKLDIYRSDGTKVAQNDNWDGSLSATFDKVGAYRFKAGSKDAALTVTLPPGSYTAQLSGVGDTTGEGVVEVYEVP